MHIRTNASELDSTVKTTASIGTCISPQQKKSGTKYRSQSIGRYKANFSEDETYRAAVDRMNEVYKDSTDLIELMEDYVDIVRTHTQNLTLLHQKWMPRFKNQSALISYGTTKDAQLEVVRSTKKLAQIDVNRCTALEIVVEQYCQTLNTKYTSKPSRQQHQHRSSRKIEELFKKARIPVAKSERRLEKLLAQAMETEVTLTRADMASLILASDSKASKKHQNRVNEYRAKNQADLCKINEKIRRERRNHHAAEKAYQKRAKDILNQCQNEEKQQLSQIKDTLICFTQAMQLKDVAFELNEIYDDIAQKITAKQHSFEDVILWAETYGIAEAQITEKNPETNRKEKKVVEMKKFEILEKEQIYSQDNSENESIETSLNELQEPVANRETCLQNLIVRKVQNEILLIALIGPITLSIDDRHSKFITIEQFDDALTCLSRILRNNDRRLYFVTTPSKGEHVVPLVYMQRNIEKIYIYCYSSSDQKLKWLKEGFAENIFVSTKLEEISKEMYRDIDLLAQNLWSWNWSFEKCVHLTLEQNTETKQSSIITDSYGHRSSELRVILLYCNGRISKSIKERLSLWQFNGISYSQFQNFDTCLSDLEKETKDVFLILVSTHTMNSKLASLLNLSTVRVAYILTLGSMNFMLDECGLCNVEKVNNQFFDPLKLKAQIDADIRFHLDYMSRLPSIGLFDRFTGKKSNKKGVLEQLTKEQSEFFAFHLFARILPLIPRSGNDSRRKNKEMTTINLKKLSASTLVSFQNFSQTRREYYDSACTLFHQIRNTSSISVYYNQVLPSKLLKRLQTIVDTHESQGCWINMQNIVLATTSYETVRSLARRAANSNMFSVLFEVKAPVGSLYTVTTSVYALPLDAIFFIKSIGFGVDGVLYIQLIFSDGDNQVSSTLLQMKKEIDKPLNWLSYGYFLSHLNMIEKATEYYDMLLDAYRETQPNIYVSIHNIIADIYIAEKQNGRALSCYERALKRNLPDEPAAPIETFAHADALSGLNEHDIDRSVILGCIADVYTQQSQFKKAVDYYREAISITNNTPLRRYYNSRLDEILNKCINTSIV